MNRKILITCAVLLLAVCLVLSVVSVFGAGYLFWNSKSQPEEIKTDNSLPTQTPISESLDPEPKDIEQDAETSNTIPVISPEILVEMELIQRQVIQDRGLEPTGVFTRVLFSKDQLRQRVMDDFLEEYDPQEEADYAIVREVFGLLNSDFDMYNFYIDLYSEQIAGFYDNETKEMVVVQGKGFEGPERLTYAHEYTHALQDQNYDIRDGLNYNEDSCEADSERCAAIQALMEGDATLSELNWFQENATIEDQTEILSFYEDYESPVLDSSPAFIAKDLLFPYESGYDFVTQLYKRGGWDLIDQAYESPPVSTEQILHPERYPDDLPIPVTLPDIESVLGDGWREIDQNVMGEWYTYLILAHGLEEDARLKEKNAAEATEGWGGDAYTVYYHSENETTVMVLRTVWETSSDSNEFISAFKDYARGRFGKPIENNGNHMIWHGGSDIHNIYVDGNTTIWIITPDQVLAESIWDAIDNE